MLSFVLFQVTACTDMLLHTCALPVEFCYKLWYGGYENNNHSGVMNTEKEIATVNIIFVTLIGTPPRLCAAE